MHLYHIPLPSEVSSKERKIAMGSYLTMFVSLLIGFPFPIVNIIASIIYFLLVLDANTKTTFTRFHAMQSLLSQLCISLLNTMFVIFTFYKLWLFFSQVFFSPFANQYTPIFSDNIDIENILNPIRIITKEYKIFIIVVIVSNALYFLLSMIALIQAGRGRVFSMPLFGYICKNIFFKTAVCSNEKDNDKKNQSAFYPFYE